jgi:hypothetical protein
MAGRRQKAEAMLFGCDQCKGLIQSHSTLWLTSGGSMDEGRQQAVNIPMEKGGSGAAGKTLGDVLDGILMEPRRGMALVALLAILCVLGIFVMFAVTRLFHMQTSEIQLGGKGSHVVLQRALDNTGSGEYVVIVNPEGWQSTGNAVSKGDHITISAGARFPST